MMLVASVLRRLSNQFDKKDCSIPFYFSFEDLLKLNPKRIENNQGGRI